MSKNKTFDVVIPYIDNGKEFKELKFALRSIEKNLQLPDTDIRVVIVGNMPDFVNPKKVKHIAIERKPVSPFPKCYDGNFKINTVILDPDTSDDFLVMYDDTYIIKPIDFSDLSVFLKNKRPKEPRNNSKHTQLLKKTYDVLDANGKLQANCETHTPRLINKANMIETFKKYYPIKNRLLFATLYYNDHFVTDDFKTIAKNNKYKIGFYGTVDDWSYASDLPAAELVEKISKYRYMNHDDAGLTDQLKEALEIMFPEKSEYEL